MKKYQILLISFFLSCNTFAQVITGQRYKSALENSINIHASNLQMLKAQALDDLDSDSEDNDGYLYWLISVKRAPVKILTSDGVLHNGIVDRSHMPFGIIRGDEVGKYFLGFNMDVVSYSNFDVLDSNKEPESKSTGQAMYHAGLKIMSFQFQIASFLNFGGTELFDGNGDFPAVGVGRVVDNSSKIRDAKRRMFTAYHSSGVFFSTIYEKIETRNPETHKLEGDYQFSEVKFNIQPLKKFLPKLLGNPFVDFMKLSPFKSYYNEAIADFANIVNIKSPYEVSLGADNFLIKGLSFEVGSRVRPDFMFRKAELSYTFGYGNFFAVGARGVLFKRNNNLDYSFDVIGMLYYLKKFNVSVSYSYNGYDLISFLPIPYSHSIGVHVLFGNARGFRFPIPSIVNYIKNDYEGVDDDY
jgi:hypothetical protein